MINPISPSEQLLFTTTRVQVSYADNTKGTGTASIYTVGIDAGRIAPFLITNKHLVEDEVHGEGINGKITVHLGEMKGDKLVPSDINQRINFNNFRSQWHFHPNNNIDLCAMPIAEVLEAFKKEGKTLFYKSFHKEDLPSISDLENLDAVEEVLMIGYPKGLYDSKNNLPLIRKGITACHPAVDFNGEKRGVVDIACFAGSSGSPIVVYSSSLRTSKDGVAKIVRPRSFYLGVLYGGPFHQADGSIEIRQVPTVSVPVSVTPQMIHLGYYIKSSVVDDLCRSHPGLK